MMMVMMIGLKYYPKLIEGRHVPYSILNILHEIIHLNLTISSQNGAIITLSL